MAIKTKFYKVYLICVIGFFVLLIIALGFLFFWLREYESCLPEKTAETVAKKYIAASNAKYLTEECNLSLSPYESEDALKSTLKKAASGQITVSLAAKTVECDAAYAVKSDGQRIMTLYLKKTDEKKPLGNKGYKVSSAAIADGLYKTATVVFPSDAHITVNGKQPKSQDIKELPPPQLSGNIVGSSKITGRKTAKIENLLTEPVIEAYSGGEKLEIQEKNGTFWVKQNISGDISQAVKETAAQSAVAYAKYMQKETDFEGVSKYLKSGTEFYRNVKTSLVKYAADHDSCVYEDIKTEEPFRHNDSLYSCKVTFTQIMTYKGQVSTEKIEKVVFVIKEQNRYSVADMQNVTDE